MEESGEKHYAFTLKPQAELFFVLLIAGLSVLFRYWALIGVPFATGPDGYFYVAQTDGLTRSLSLPFPDFSGIYVLFLFAGLIFEDSLFAVKVVSALLSGLFLISLYYVGIENTRKNLIPLILVVMGLFSPAVTFLAANYPKALLGLCGINLFLAAVGTKDLKWAFPAFMINIFLYSLTAWLCFFMFMAFLISRSKVSFLPVAALAMVLATLVFPGFFLFREIGSSSWRMDLQFVIPPVWYLNHIKPDGLSFFHLVETILGLGTFLFGLGYALLGKLDSHPQRRMFFYLLAVVSVMLFPLIDTQNPRVGMHFSLTLAFILPLAILFLREMHFAQKLPLVLVLLGLGLFSWKSYPAATLNNEYVKLEAVFANFQKEVAGKQVEFVTAPQTLALFISAKKIYKTVPWVEDPAHYSHDTYFRISSGISLSDATRLVPEETKSRIKDLGQGYLVWYEIDWQLFANSLSAKNEMEIENIAHSLKNPWYTKKELPKADPMIIP